MLTGDRPTGPLHLGHYVGTLANRVRLQAAGVEVFLVIADYQVVTDRDVAGDVRGTVRELLLDYLAAGIVPRGGTAPAVNGATVFTHSALPATCGTSCGPATSTRTPSPTAPCAPSGTPWA